MNVLQTWVIDLPLMQQTVLLCALRGPDGIRKDHIAKLILRWYRRCVLISAFDKGVIRNPYCKGGGSFTGPSLVGDGFGWYSSGLYNWHSEMSELVVKYLHTVDELPHHFQLHLMHAAEILGYKHPEEYTRIWWLSMYRELVNDMHLNPESEQDMDKRLGDVESQWRERERAPAYGPSGVPNAQTK